MKTYIHAAYVILFILLFIGGALTIHKNNEIDSRLNTFTNHFKTDAISSDKTFKEDYYITQQSNDTSLILCCFGAGLVIFSFLTFQSTVTTVKAELREIHEKYNKRDQEYKEQHIKLKILEKDFNYLLGDYYYERAEKINSVKYAASYIQNSLVSCEKYALGLKLSDDESPEIKESYYNSILLILETLVEISDNLEQPIYYLNVKPKRFELRVTDIMSVLKPAHQILLHKVCAKIQLKKEEE